MNMLDGSVIQRVLRLLLARDAGLENMILVAQLGTMRKANIEDTMRLLDMHLTGLKALL